jgi:hypothetical protein
MKTIKGKDIINTIIITYYYFHTETGGTSNVGDIYLLLLDLYAMRKAKQPINTWLVN